MGSRIDKAILNNQKALFGTAVPCLVIGIALSIMQRNKRVAASRLVRTVKVIAYTTGVVASMAILYARSSTPRSGPKDETKTEDASSKDIEVRPPTADELLNTLREEETYALASELLDEPLNSHSRLEDIESAIAELVKMEEANQPRPYKEDNLEDARKYWTNFDGRKYVKIGAAITRLTFIWLIKKYQSDDNPLESAAMHLYHQNKKRPVAYKRVFTAFNCYREIRKGTYGPKREYIHNQEKQAKYKDLFYTEGTSQSKCRSQYNQIVPMMKLFADEIVELPKRYPHIKRTDVRYQKHAIEDNKLEFVFRPDSQPT